MEKQQKIVCIGIIQMMGSPKEHIEETIKLYVDKIDEDYKHITVVNKKIEDAKEAEDNPGVFDVFAEVEMEVEGIENLAWWCIDYMPTSIEIVEPENLDYKANDLTAFMNDLLEKLHRVGNELKKTRMVNEAISTNGVVLMKNMLKLDLKYGDKTPKELSETSGAPVEHVQRFLDTLEKEGKIKKKGDKYTVEK